MDKSPKTNLEGADLGTGRAIADFEATAENQLSLKVGDMVKIQSKSSSGWWQGEASYKFFPKIF